MRTESTRCWEMLNDVKPSNSNKETIRINFFYSWKNWTVSLNKHGSNMLLGAMRILKKTKPNRKSKELSLTFWNRKNLHYHKPILIKSSTNTSKSQDSTKGCMMWASCSRRISKYWRSQIRYLAIQQDGRLTNLRTSTNR